MQILPSTARDPLVGIPDIHRLENNIHAGATYLRILMNRDFSEEQMAPLNRTLLTLAAYNAGPAQVERLRRYAEEAELEKDLWFNNVEVAASRKIGREPVDYFNNIAKYYFAYQRILSLEGKKQGTSL